jgi:hypothetical protein
MGGLNVKLTVALAAALVAGLVTAPVALAGNCEAGDPVYDPGSNSPCNFAVSPVTPGASALVHGRYFGTLPSVYQPSYVKDTADDGLDAYLWVRSTVDGQPREKLVKQASGPGATTTVSGLGWDIAGTFQLRVCVGEGTANCSAWSD